MGVDEILELVMSRVRALRSAGEEPAWASVFGSDVLEALARLVPQDYEKFKLKLEGALLLERVRLKGLSERVLDRAVAAALLRVQEQGDSVPLKECCPEAPGCEGLGVPAGWEVGPECVAIAGGGAVAAGAVYIGARYLDAERGKAYFRLVVCADGEWRTAMVPADASDRKLVSAVQHAGVLVLSPDRLAEYLRAFLALNWPRLPVARSEVEGDGLFELFRDHVVQHFSRFSGSGAGRWGAVRESSEGVKELLVLPDVLRRFLRGQGAPFHQALSAWRRQGWLLAPDDGLLAPRWFGGRVRRVAVFPADLFDLEGQVRERLQRTAGPGAAGG